MLAELKDRSQLTIPKSVVNDLGLSTGDMFDVVARDGVIYLVPVVVYPKSEIESLEKLAAEARSSDANVFSNPDAALSYLHAK